MTFTTSPPPFPFYSPQFNLLFSLPKFSFLLSLFFSALSRFNFGRSSFFFGTGANCFHFYAPSACGFCLSWRLIVNAKYFNQLVGWLVDALSFPNFLMESIWTHNGVPSVSHFIVAFYFAFAFVAARFILDRFIFRRLAIWLLSRGTTQLKLNEETRAKIAKCSESMWKFTYYATIEFFTLAAIYQEPWFKDVKAYFTGWPDQELKLPVKLIYMCECGFYIYSIAALLTWETRRKDFSVMMSHHVITVILIAYSYITRFFRIGAVILALHDASDVFLEAAKVFKYSGKELGASVCFGLFALSWLVLRLIFFPFWVIRSSSYYLCEVLVLSQPYSATLYYLFNTMLLTLLVFHIYWWILICSMITRQLKNRGQVGEDIRSDSEDDD
ncbi:hypothetical protein Pfo_004772 [Paulownia fortunei]|nr:hypothetical protein Pfo_004772 [Paulownia fortunei]